MQDRVSLYPGRVKLAPVSGQENTYDMVRADSPTQEGTPLSKATFLKDTTAALFGLGADAVPDDVLEFLGKYSQYWWKRRVYTVNAQKVSTHPVKTIGEWVYIMSSDRNAYPDSGITGGYEYQYLGVPFENAVTAVQIATGSYTGTGTYGKANPNSLTFEFEPNVVIITPGFVNSDNLDGHGYIFTNGAKTAASFGDYSYASRSHYSINITWGQNKITFYADGNDGVQCNKPNYKYHYIAIG